jgi:hypothetical protein
MSELLEAYLSIGNLVPETCKVEKVRRTSDSKNESGDTVYGFVAVVVAPTTLADLKADEDVVKQIVKHAKKEMEHFGGPDLKHRVTWDKKNGTKGKFDFSAHLIPENIQGIEVNDGILRVTCKAYGALFS